MDDPHVLAALLTVGDPGQLTGGYLFHKRLAELAPRYAARLEFVSVPARPFPLGVIDAPGVFERVRRTGAEILVLDSIAAAFVGPWLTLRKPSVPMVGMLHQPPGGIDYGPARSGIQAWLDRLAYRHADRLLVASDSLAEDFLRSGEAPQRIVVVPPGRDVAATAGPPPGDLRQGRNTAFVCVGNWVERKGIVSLLEAFAALPPDAATLHLVGNTLIDPVYARRVRAWLSRPELATRVVVHGPVTLSQVAALYAAGDAFVLPSLKEPYGTVYGEAMAYGLPVVGWRAGNLPYLADNDREGLLVEPGDIPGLTAAMQRLADKPDLRRRLGEAARARALGRPTWDQVAELFFDQLRAVLAASQLRSPR